MTTPIELVLASGSPRRRELLTRRGMPFSIRPTDVDETPRAGESPREMVERLALAKARAAARPGEVALGADTVVALGEQVLGKPRDEAEARRMLQKLSGRTHEVWTGVAVFDRRAGVERVHRRAVRTAVTFRVLSESEIADYVASDEPSDKAGAYAIQGGAAAFVEQLEGDYDNVVGLPLTAVEEMLAELDPPVSPRT